MKKQTYNSPIANVADIKTEDIICTSGEASLESVNLGSGRISWLDYEIFSE